MEYIAHKNTKPSTILAFLNAESITNIIFNGLIGNCDAHAKNVSFIHGEKGTILAPFYDLLSTYVYPYAKNTTEEFFDLYGKSPVLNEINDVIKNSSTEKLKFFFRN